MDGWMDGWMDGRMDGGRDGCRARGTRIVVSLSLAVISAQFAILLAVPSSFTTRGPMFSPRLKLPPPTSILLSLAGEDSGKPRAVGGRERGERREGRG